MEQLYIRVFFDDLDAIEPLDDAERGRLFTALLEYGRTGVVPELGGNERFIFPMMRARMDRERRAVEDLQAKRQAAGSAGGRQRKANAEPLCDDEQDEAEEANEANVSKAKQSVANEANASFAKQNLANEASASFAKQSVANPSKPDKKEKEKIKENINLIEKEKDKKEKDSGVFAAFAAGDLELSQALSDYEEHRRKMKRPITTDRARSLICKGLDTLCSGDHSMMIAVIEQSLANGWQGLFAPRDGPQGRSAPKIASTATKTSQRYDFDEIQRQDMEYLKHFAEVENEQTP